MDQEAIQREYYRSTASKYDQMHLGDPEHEFALAVMVGLIRHFQIGSVLDVGSGTGRAILAVKNEHPDVKALGIEPSDGLRNIGHGKGLDKTDLIDGNAQSIAFADKSFDLVCAFGVMHHVPNPDLAVKEMARVARRAVFISDHNDPGRGSAATKMIKRAIKTAGLWNLYKLAITRGNGYRITEDDGLWYPYSILDTYKTIRPFCTKVQFFGTLPSKPNLYGASHIAMLGTLD